MKFDAKIQSRRYLAREKNNFSTFIPVFVLAFITEIVVDMCILPLSDTELGGGLPYQ
jgi:hypothetical protein